MDPESFGHLPLGQAPCPQLTGLLGVLGGLREPGSARSLPPEPPTPARIAHSLAPLLAMFSAARPNSFESATALPSPADHRDRLQVASSKAYGSSKRKGRRKSIARVAAPAARSGANSWPAPS